MKKRILLVVCFCAVSLLSTHLLGVPYRLVKLPYANEKDTRYPPYDLLGLNVRCYGLTDTHLSQWSDIQLTPYIQEDPYWSHHGYLMAFDTMDKDFRMGIYEFGSDPIKSLLYTVTPDSLQLIDAITVGAKSSSPATNSSSSAPFVELKQYAISADYEVTVYTLLPIHNVPIDAYDLFLSRITPIRAQRIDTTYKIDDEGYFHQINEVKYFPQTYCVYQFVGKHYNVWDGYETVQWLNTRYTFKPPYEIYF